MIMAQEMINAMHEFQRKHEIKKQCMTNCQYLRDSLIASGLAEVKVKVVYAIGSRLKTKDFVVVEGHLVVETPGGLLDPSYEIASLDQLSYYDNIYNLKKDNPNIPYENIKRMIEENIKFHSYAETINNNKIIVADKDVYNRQADYVQTYFQTHFPNHLFQ